MHTLLLIHNALIVHTGPVYRMTAVVIMLVAPKEPSCQATGKLVKIITIGVTFAFSVTIRERSANLHTPQSHVRLPSEIRKGRDAEVKKRGEDCGKTEVIAGKLMSELSAASQRHDVNVSAAPSQAGLAGGAENPPRNKAKVAFGGWG